MDAEGVKAGIGLVLLAIAAGVVPVEMVAVVAGVVVGGLAYPRFADDPPAVPHAAVEIEAANLGQVLHGGGDAAKGVGRAALGAVDVDEGRRLHLQGLPHFLAQVVGKLAARRALDDNAQYLGRHALVAVLGARLVAEFQSAYLLHHVVAVVEPGDGVKALEMLEVKAVGVVEIESALHVQQVADGQLLPHGGFLLQLGQVVGDGVVDAADVAVVDGDAAHERGDGLGNGEDGGQAVGRDVAPVFLIDDAVVMYDHHSLCLAFRVQCLGDDGVGPVGLVRGEGEAERRGVVGNDVTGALFETVDVRSVGPVGAVCPDDGA